MDKTYEHWLLKKEGHIGVLTLNRPEANNRIDNTTLEELGMICEVIKNDSQIWVVILEGEGDGFSAGVDVSLIGNMVGQKSEEYRANLRKAQGFLDQFEALKKPTIAALHGHVIGGGVILSLCCDFRIAAHNTTFGLPEVKRSIGVIMGTQRITRTIGVAHTKELVMLGRSINAERAHQMGLVNQLVPINQLKETTMDFAKQFLELPPLAVGLCKEIIDQGEYLERSGQDLEIEAQETLLHTNDFKEAINSFFEKRPPKYTGN